MFDSEEYRKFCELDCQSFTPYYAKDDSFSEIMKEMFSWYPEREKEMDVLFNTNRITCVILVRSWLNKELSLKVVVYGLREWYNIDDNTLMMKRSL